MNIKLQWITILIVILTTMGTRFLPFFLFPERKNPPNFILYLGKVLPPSIMGLLIIYCLSSQDLSQNYPSLNEIISLLIIVLLYYFKKNTLLCILGGTLVYMILVNVGVF